MGFESQGGDSFSARSPGGFEFGVQGFSYGNPTPKSITFFLDNTCIVADQYGRCIRRAILDSGEELRFADCPPDGDKDGRIVPRPQFATHAQTIAALLAERIEWLAYEVRWRDKSGAPKVKDKLTMDAAVKLQAKLLGEGNNPVAIDRTVACAGWPQLPLAELKKLPELPPTPIEELRKIRDPELRKAALIARREVDEVRAKEMSAAEDE